MVTPAAPTMPTAGDLLDNIREEYNSLGMGEYVDAAQKPRTPQSSQAKTLWRRKSKKTKYVGRHR